MKRFERLFLAPSEDGAGAPEQGQEPGNDREPDPVRAELEGLRQQLEDERKRREDAERRISEAEKARLTDDERKAAEDKELRDATISKFKQLQAKALGIDERYASLIGGSTPEEIEAAAALLAEMLQKKAEEVEAGVKMSMARTGAPGASAAIGEEMDPKEFYAGIMKEQKGR